MVIAAALLLVQAVPAEVAPSEERFYPVTTLSIPEELVLEVGGIALLPDGRPLVCTRRGEVWLLEDAYSPDGQGVGFERWAEGLQEPLGLLIEQREGRTDVYTVQRGELTRMNDTDDDDRCDELVTVADPWRISGNYHEYAFGPARGPDGRLWVTLNRPFGEEPFGSVEWRGFALALALDGSWEPIACGLRSPCGIATSPWGDVFYTDNQGEWNGTNKLAQLEPGDFHGHPWGSASTKLPEWKHGEVAEPPDGILYPEAARTIPCFKLPAVWFPYDKMGRSAAGFVWDTSAGKFGPFAGSVFVGDQYDASVMRVTLERSESGRWHGACYPFRVGLQSGVTRVAWGADGSLLVGMTNRGWGSKGQGTFGLQRIRWSGELPFEIREMRSVPGGFELEFTAPVEPALAADPASYRMTSYTYELHEAYGSDEMDTQELVVSSAAVNGSSVRLAIGGLRPGYVHELHLGPLRSAAGEPLLHDRAYYTLLETPVEPASAGEASALTR